MMADLPKGAKPARFPVNVTYSTEGPRSLTVRGHARPWNLPGRLRSEIVQARASLIENMGQHPDGVHAQQCVRYAVRVELVEGAADLHRFEITLTWAG